MQCRWGGLRRFEALRRGWVERSDPVLFDAVRVCYQGAPAFTSAGVALGLPDPKL